MLRNLSALFGMLLILTGCGDRTYQQQSYVFGTLVEVSIYGEPKPKADAAAGKVLQEFDRLHRTFHAWKNSSITEINAAFSHGQSIPVTPEIALAIQDSSRYMELSEGTFNPAIGQLIALWGFQADEFKPVRPKEADIQALLDAKPSMSDVYVFYGRASSRNPAVRLDFGGYAKGLALDIAVQELRAEGIKNALINIGGNIIAMGSKGGTPWHVGIQHPRQPSAIAELDLHDGEAIGTSGDYQRYFELDGQRYCHIIDPRTGYPAQGMQAVTVLVQGAAAGVRSDVTSKPIFIAGPQKWEQAAERMRVNSVMVIDAEGKIEMTPAMAARVRLLEHPAKRQSPAKAK